MLTAARAALGTALLIYGAAIGPTWNIWQINIAPPDLKYGLGFAPMREGGLAKMGLKLVVDEIFTPPLADPMGHGLALMYPDVPVPVLALAKFSQGRAA